MKRLIICCDGTWNRADQEVEGEPCPTNVVKIANRIAKRDVKPNGTAVLQVLFYDQGVGTGNVLDRYSGGALGTGLAENILDAYRFLIANYEPDDEIYLFGFSRGAFTARSVAGMVRNCGILKRTSIRQYREAVALYRDRERGPNHPDSVAFRSAHSLTGPVDVPIKLIGVWDTVGALGIPLRGLRALTRGDEQFHDTELSGSVEYAYHALAVDERRGPFDPTLWAYKRKPNQRVEQVWFAGVHSDVGGGYPPPSGPAGAPPPMLSDIALDWMIDRARGPGWRSPSPGYPSIPIPWRSSMTP